MVCLRGLFNGLLLFESRLLARGRLSASWVRFRGLSVVRIKEAEGGVLSARLDIEAGVLRVLSMLM